MTDAALAVELRALREEIAALRESHAELVLRLLSADDRRLGGVLVPLLADLCGGEAFTAASLAASALNGRGPEWQAVRELVAPFVTGTGGVRSLGRLLVRLAGVEFNGCRLVAAGVERGAQRWRVRS